ncbi:MAG: DNA-binding protein [Moraxellaceae bacterium]|nr:MAG: DNA-binding protein [Moraxellaceae bacterium]
MNEYEFVLRFQLPESDDQPEQYLDALYEAGCDDATVGVGLPGYIGLDFCREADSAEKAFASAITDVKSAIPNAKLTEVTPDLLNISEIADLISSRLQKISRQAMRKYAYGQVAKMKRRFPAAAVTSSSPLWHVDEVVIWLVENNKTDKTEAQKLFETSKTARTFNFKLQAQAIQNGLSSFDATAP